LPIKEGHTFTPLVFESFGGFGDKARDFIRRAADVGVDVAGGGVMERSQIMHDIRCSIAFSIINGNARLIKNGMLLADRRRVLPQSMLQVRRRNGVVSMHARHTVRRR
jgi:ribosomal protein S9